MARKASGRRKGGYKSLAWMSQLLNGLFKLLQRIMDKLSGKETVKKAKSLEETVANQQSMVKGAEEAFSSDMQRAERNFNEVKRSMEAHKMALGLGGDQAESTTNAYNEEPAEAPEVETRIESNQEPEMSSQKATSESENLEEENAITPRYTDVRKSLPKVIHHAIGGLAINGKAINPYDIKQWFTEGELKTQFDQIRSAICDKAVQLAKGEEPATNKDEIQQLLFEQLAGSLLGQRTTDANRENQEKLGVALSLLLHEASGAVEHLAAQLKGIEDEKQLEASVSSFQNHFFSSSNLKLIDEKVRAFVHDIAPDAPASRNVIAIKVFEMWFAHQAPRYQDELDEGHSILSGQDYHGHTFFVAPEDDKDKEKNDGDTPEEPGVEIEDADYTEHQTYSHDNDGQQSPGLAEEGREDQPGDDSLHELEMEEVQHADEMPFGKHKALNQVEAQIKGEPAPKANKMASTKPTVVGDEAPYSASMAEEQFEAVNDSTVIEDYNEAQKSEEEPKPAPPNTNGRSYGDAHSVPVNEDFTF